MFFIAEALFTRAAVIMAGAQLVRPRAFLVIAVQRGQLHYRTKPLIFGRGKVQGVEPADLGKDRLAELLQDISE